MRNDRLPGSHLDNALFVAHVQASAQDQREFFEFGSLSGFFPTGRTAHVGNANAAFPAVQPANIFVNNLGKIPGRLHARGLSYECGQKNSLKLVLNRLRLKTLLRRTRPRYVGHIHLLISGGRLEERSILAALFYIAEIELCTIR